MPKKLLISLGDKSISISLSLEIWLETTHLSLSRTLEGYEEEGFVAEKATFLPVSDVHCHHPRWYV